MANQERKTGVGEPAQEPRESSWLKGLLAGGWIDVLLLGGGFHCFTRRTDTG